MLKNYFLIAIRNFQRQKLFSCSTCLASHSDWPAPFSSSLYVSDELQYDNMHPYGSNTYRVGCTVTNPQGEQFDNTVAPGYWTKHLKDTRPDVVANVLVDNIGYPTSLHHKAKDKIILTEEIRWAEPGFNEVIYFKLLKGNNDKIFEDQNSMVLSETGALKLFGDADPIGEIVTVKHQWATNGKEIDLKVTGVYQDLPANSHFKPLYILNVNALKSVVDDFNTYMNGTTFRAEFFENYLVLQKDADVDEIVKSLQKTADLMAQWRFVFPRRRLEDYALH